jgi:hypothetical protein
MNPSDPFTSHTPQPDTGDIPVPAGTYVEVVRRSGTVARGFVGNTNQLLDHLYWVNSNHSADIVHYRVVKAAAAAEIKLDDPYAKLADVLSRALKQASEGKGKERHANDGVPFEEQPMSTICREQGSVDGMLFQARKKSLESKRLPAGRDVAEVLGAINYLAGVVIAYESWAKKDGAA